MTLFKWMFCDSLDCECWRSSFLHMVSCSHCHDLADMNLFPNIISAAKGLDTQHVHFCAAQSCTCTKCTMLKNTINTHLSVYAVDSHNWDEIKERWWMQLKIVILLGSLFCLEQNIIDEEFCNRVLQFEPRWKVVEMVPGSQKKP